MCSVIFLVRVFQRGNVVTDRDWSFDNPTESHHWSQFDTDNDFCSAFQSLSLTTLHGWWLTIKNKINCFFRVQTFHGIFFFFFLVRCTRNPPLFFAETLEKAISGIGSDSKTVTRVVVTRSEVICYETIIPPAICFFEH